MTSNLLIAWQLGPALLATPGTPTPFVAHATQVVVAQPTVPYLPVSRTTDEQRDDDHNDYLNQQANDYERDLPEPDDGWCGAGRYAYEC